MDITKSFTLWVTIFFICGIIVLSGCTGNSEGPTGNTVSTPDSSSDESNSDCQDTDGGKNYEKKGTVLDKYNKVHTDYCEQGVLHEFYCREDDIVDIDFFHCPDSCSNGKCITEKITSTTIKTKKTTTTITSISSKTVSLDDFWRIYCDDEGTDLQKKDALDKCNDKAGDYIIESGEIYEVKSDGDNTYLLVAHCPHAIYPQAKILLKDNQKSKALKLKKGDSVEYKAILKKCGSFGWFYKGIEAEEGMILSVKTTTTTTTTIPYIPTTTVSSSDSPSKVTETYFRELMNPRRTDHEKMYNLISENARPSDYYSWKDDLVLIKSALAQQGVYFSFDEVINEEVNGDKATVSLRFQLSQYLTKIPATRSIELVNEGGSWKLAESYDYDTLM